MMSVVLIAVLLGVASGQTTDLDALYLMTLNVTNKRPSWLQSTPACQWEGVGCNADGHVVQIEWSSFNLGGYPNLATLPQGLQYLDVAGNQLTGNPNLGTLPQGLQHLDLSINEFTGTPDLAMLPQGLQHVDLSANQLTGTPNLGMLQLGSLFVTFNVVR